MVLIYCMQSKNTYSHTILLQHCVDKAAFAQEDYAEFNLDFYCKAFGIDSPKAHGVTGMDVNSLLAGKKFREIAEYCLRDVQATVELYRIWKDRLAGIK